MNVKAAFETTKNKPGHSSYSNGRLLAMDGHVAVKPQLPPSQSVLPAFSDFGSKEEIFFDSQAWLDSDYEDDFMSVNGEFTPSRGNTPVHHSLLISKGNTSMDHAEPLGPMAQPSPAPSQKKKRLLDFFKESQRDNHTSSTNQLVEPPANKHGDQTSSKKDGLHQKRGRPAGFMSCCFTRLPSVRIVGRRNKKNPVSAQKFASR